MEEGSGVSCGCLCLKTQSWLLSPGGGDSPGLLAPGVAYTWSLTVVMNNNSRDEEPLRGGMGEISWLHPQTAFGLGAVHSGSAISL